MLSDVAAMPTGSLGDADPKTGKRRALYEPVHGSAPDIAGKGLANPIWRRRSQRFSPRACEPPTSRATARASCPRAKWEARSSPNWGARTPKASPTKRISAGRVSTESSIARVTPKHPSSRGRRRRRRVSKDAPEHTNGASFWIILRRAMLRIAAQDEDGRGG